eukprot:360061-Chlamydomonas_euryale.AAC.1
MSLPKVSASSTQAVSFLDPSCQLPRPSCVPPLGTLAHMHPLNRAPASPIHTRCTQPEASSLAEVVRQGFTDDLPRTYRQPPPS